MTSDHRKDVAVLLAIGAAAAALIVWLILRSARGSANDPLAAVPVDSFLVATLDVRALAESPIGEAIAVCAPARCSAWTRSRRRAASTRSRTSARSR
jgi:hypothetical protein